MRRSPGGLLLLVSAVFAALAFGSLWLQHVAFSPSSNSSVTYSILGDEDIRIQIATVVASADAPVLSQAPLQLREFVDDIAQIPAGAALMSRFVAEGHALLIGEFDGPVRIDAEEQVSIVRDERVGDEDPITVPVQRVGSMSFLDTWLKWFAVACGGVSLLTLLAGIILRPERGEGTFALGTAFASTAVSLFGFGFLVPLVALPVFADDPWMGVFPQLAKHHRNITVLMAVLALAIAALIVFGTSSRRERRQHSTPLNVGRYRDDRSWSH